MPSTEGHPAQHLRRTLLRQGLVAGGAVALGPWALQGLLGPGLVDLGDIGLAHAGFPSPPIVSRRQWGADESLRTATRTFAPIAKGVVHHTVTNTTEPDPAARVRAIYRYHVEGNGWDDIGYNFLIDASGRIYEGRWARDYPSGEVHSGEDDEGRGVVGAHAAGHNTGTFGVALLGTYSSASVSITGPAMAALADLFAWKFGTRGIDPRGASTFRRSNGTSANVANVCGHRDLVATGCPGDGLYHRLPELRDLVAGRLTNRPATVGLVGRPGGRGYWVTSSEGGVTAFGDARPYGNLRGQPLNGPVLGMAAHPSGRGYWLVASDGGVFSFGEAPFHGSTGGMRLNRPVVGMAAHRSGQGYWMVASDGGVFSFGEAPFHGSTGGMRLNRPVVGMAATPGGGGYWLVAADGGIFSFGDARFFGSTGGISLQEPIVGMATTPSGDGYWLVAADGGLFTFGDAPFLGSAVGGPLTRPARAVATTPDGDGYWILGSNGDVHAFGEARE